MARNHELATIESIPKYQYNCSSFQPHLEPSTPFATTTLPAMATEAYKYGCHLCPKSFTRSSNLIYHLSTHEGIKPFSCSVCSGCFTRAHDRNQHLKEKHTDCQLYCCRQRDTSGRWSGCGRGFKRERDLERHRSSQKGQRCRHLEPESVQATHTSLPLLTHQPWTFATTSGKSTSDEDIQHPPSSVVPEDSSRSGFAQQLIVAKSLHSFRPSICFLYDWNSIAVKAVEGLVASLNVTFEKPQPLPSGPHALPGVILYKQHKLLVCAQILLKDRKWAPLVLCVSAIYTVAAIEGDIPQLYTHAMFLIGLVRKSHESGLLELRDISPLTEALGKYSAVYGSESGLYYSSRPWLNDKYRPFFLLRDTRPEFWKVQVASDVKGIRSLLVKPRVWRRCRMRRRSRIPRTSSKQ